MKTPDANAIAAITIETLERTAFVLADHIDPKQASELPAPTYFSAIEYTGPHTGSVHLAASKGFLLELASSILGLEPNDINPDEEGIEALNELANIVGGGIVLDLGGIETSFKLGLPKNSKQDSVHNGLPDSVVSCLDSEGELLRITWQPVALEIAHAA